MSDCGWRERPILGRTVKDDKGRLEQLGPASTAEREEEAAIRAWRRRDILGLSAESMAECVWVGGDG